VVLKAVPVKSTKGSSSTWYKVRLGSKYYYVASDKVKLTETAVQVQDPAPAPAADPTAPAVTNEPENDTVSME
jgi:hypothetical protein